MLGSRNTLISTSSFCYKIQKQRRTGKTFCQHSHSLSPRDDSDGVQTHTEWEKLWFWKCFVLSVGSWFTAAAAAAAAAVSTAAAAVANVNMACFISLPVRRFVFASFATEAIRADTHWVRIIYTKRRTQYIFVPIAAYLSIYSVWNYFFLSYDCRVQRLEICTVRWRCSIGKCRHTHTHANTSRVE